MNPDGPTAVTVTLIGGPCDGQIVNVWPRSNGEMPRVVSSVQPAPPRDINTPPARPDYHLYARHGNGRLQYDYVPDLLGQPEEEGSA